MGLSERDRAQTWPSQHTHGVCRQQLGRWLTWLARARIGRMRMEMSVGPHCSPAWVQLFRAEEALLGHGRRAGGGALGRVEPLGLLIVAVA